MNASRQGILTAARSGQSFVPRPKELAVFVSGTASSDFAAEARRSDAEVLVEQDREGVAARVKELCAGQGVMAWDLGSFGASLGLKLASTRAEATVGLTACHKAIADTGSLVLVAGPGCPREASLVVRTHVALVDPADLVPDLASALQYVARLGPRAAHVNIITGPSRTADIEMTLTRGVHGPKRLVIILGPWREGL